MVNPLWIKILVLIDASGNPSTGSGLDKFDEVFAVLDLVSKVLPRLDRYEKCISANLEVSLNGSFLQVIHHR